MEGTRSAILPSGLKVVGCERCVKQYWYDKGKAEQIDTIRIHFCLIREYIEEGFSLKTSTVEPWFNDAPRVR